MFHSGKGELEACLETQDFCWNLLCLVLKPDFSRILQIMYTQKVEQAPSLMEMLSLITTFAHLGMKISKMSDLPVLWTYITQTSFDANQTWNLAVSPLLGLLGYACCPHSMYLHMP